MTLQVLYCPDMRKILTEVKMMLLRADSALYKGDKDVAHYWISKTVKKIDGFTNAG